MIIRHVCPHGFSRLLRRFCKDSITVQWGFYEGFLAVGLVAPQGVDRGFWV